jgi:glycerol-3-phosphate dehydrogenase
MSGPVLDLLVIGGGVNGVGLAREALGRGHTAMIVERGDLAGATSSASSKLIHGGLRYLEHYEFRLVREALAEREVLLRAAPHIIWPMRFVLPHRPEMRPRWMIRAGLFLYDHLAKRVSLPACAALNPRRHPAGTPLRPEIAAAFVYSDAWVDDARLVVLNARDAVRRGAQIRLRTALVSARRAAGLWRCTLRDAAGCEEVVQARAIANAAGPWAGEALGLAGAKARGRVRLIKGSHIVLPALYDGPEAFILQNDDRRVVFVIPYEGRFSLVGTTDVPFEGDAREARASEEEIAYLCAAVGKQFRQAPRPEAVVHSYAGVRPLYDDGAESASAVTRDYVLEMDAPGDGAAPMLSVFGGKITTYRCLAEDAVAKLGVALGRGAGTPWTAGASLPGGEFGGLDLPRFEEESARRYPWLPRALLRRLVRSYGSELDAVLGGARRMEELGRDLGAGLSERELEWLCREEWAATAEDVLWRRSKLGLHMTLREREDLAGRMCASGVPTFHAAAG